MIRRRYICKKCGCKFEETVFEKGEAKERGVPTGRVRCPQCRNDDVEPR